MMIIEKATGGITAPRGFRAAGVDAGIKAAGLDLALLVSDAPATAAAVFTTNLAKAAPVLVSREHLDRSGGVARAVVANSGCANACTGADGIRVARETAAETARLVGCPIEQVLVASTGVIGTALSLDKVQGGLSRAITQLGADQSLNAARAIMTTDRAPKQAAARLMIGDQLVTVGGMAKGAGMIEPNMATMLGFVTTDARLPQRLAEQALREAVAVTFNAITIDGECSTNDTVMLLANGLSGVTIDETTYDSFVGALRSVCLDLALAIVRGGEGATKLVTVSVTGAASEAEARQAAKAIANSLLVKTAINGGDPNWGRIVAVAGRCGVQFELSGASVTLGSILLFENGVPHDERAPQAAAYLRNDDIAINIHLGAGRAAATVWTCDLSAEYVRINADYRT